MAFDDTATVSGSVVSIENGADEVGAKSCVVTFPASLSGVSSVTETQTGRNLIDGTDFTRGLPSTTIGASIETITASTRYAYFGTPIKDGNYNVSSVSTDSDYYNAILIFGYTNGELSVYTGGTVNGNKNVDLSGCNYVRIAIGTRNNTFTVPTDFTDYGTIQLEVGSSSSAYVPYETPTQYTASLGRTIYGGQVDIVNGDGQVTGVMIDLSQVEWTNFTTSGNRLYINTAYPNIKAPATNADIPECVCNTFPTISRANMGYSAPFTRGITIDRDGLLIIANPDDATWTSKEAAIASLAQMGAVCVIPLATGTDFTFTGQEVPTRLGYNAFWSDSGDTELTYYKSGYGFTSVTVNRTGKNLLPTQTIVTSGNTHYVGGADSYFFFKKGTYTESNLGTGAYMYWRKKDTTDNNIIHTYNSNSGTFTLDEDCEIRFWYYYVGTPDFTNIQIELGSSPSSYVPYEAPVSKTAKLHKVIYAGEVDVIKGTAKPKNLFDADNPNVISGYISTTAFSTGNQNAKTVYVPIKVGTTYTVSKTAGQRFQIATSNVIPSDGALYTSRVSQSGSQSSLTITSGANDTYLWAWVFLDGTDTGTLAEMLSSVQIEEGSYASDYVPGFTPFTFPPISMSTDEGENTLYADEGDSVITYRKAVD